MFNLEEFISRSIVNGTKDKTFSPSYSRIMATNYLLKGVLSEENVASIDSQIEAWEAEQVHVEVVEDKEIVIDDEVMEEFAEDVVDESTESIDEIETEVVEEITSESETDVE